MLNHKSIKLDTSEFSVREIKATQRRGPHSGKELAGLEVEIVARGEEAVGNVDALLKKSELLVSDPIADRAYRASVQMKSSMHTQGRPERFYTLVVSEVDPIPEVREIEINGQLFTVLKYVENLHGDVVSRYALLKLTGNQLLDLRDMFKLDPVAVMRIGVDETLISCRFGGAMYWSRHGEGEGRFYKHIVRLFPAEDRPKNRSVGIAPLAEHRALARMNFALSARVEALLEHLASTGVLSAEKKDELMKEDWRTLINESRLVALGEEVRRVPDAEDELD